MARRGRRLAYAPREQPRDGRARGAARSLERELGAVAASLGATIRAERSRRRLALRTLGEWAGVSFTTISGIESGRVASLESYLRLGRALGLRPQFELVDRRAARSRLRDAVHAAMGEFEAARFGALGLQIRLDEPYQHYQFAGRADFVAWSPETLDLLHIENKTAFPDLQEAFGSFGAKRTYLGAELARRFGIGRWRSETHIMAILWSTEALAVVRRNRASFEAVGADAEVLATWWSGRRPSAGAHSGVVALDPLKRRSVARPWASIGEALAGRARYASYARAVEALERPNDGRARGV
jgi:transcriptional regulator with XRE-family HTH domain